MYEINETHDPNLKSWVESANDPNTDFPIQNLPFCTYKNRYGAKHRELGVRIGDQIIEFEVLTSGQLLSEFERFPINIEDVITKLELQTKLRRILVKALREDADPKT